MIDTTQRLKTALCRTLSDATFVIGQTEFKKGGVTSTRYDNRNAVTPEGLREIHQRNRFKDTRPEHAQTASVNIFPTVAAELADILRDILGQHIDERADRIGNAFPLGGDGGHFSKMTPEHAAGCTRITSLETFVAGLVRGAAVLGPDRMAGLLERWSGGEPIRYRTCTLVGLTLEKPLTPMEGIDIVPLPTSTDQLPAALPRGDSVFRSEFLARTVVSVETTATPALFHPESEYAKETIDIRLSPKIRLDNLETIWHALSLQCNQYIGTGLQWNDYGELSAIMDSVTPTTWNSPDTYMLQPDAAMTVSSDSWSGTGTATLRLRDGALRSLSEQEFCHLLKALLHVSPRIRMAVTRWRNSVRPLTSLTSQFIELRIALESLFLPEPASQEMKFRLAVTGAWWLGKDPQERARIWETLRNAYDAASQAVHRGEVKANDTNTTLLAAAQSLCRTAILRVLREGTISNPTSMILGAPHHPSSPTPDEFGE